MSRYCNFSSQLVTTLSRNHAEPCVGYLCVTFMPGLATCWWWDQDDCRTHQWRLSYFGADSVERISGTVCREWIRQNQIRVSAGMLRRLPALFHEGEGHYSVTQTLMACFYEGYYALSYFMTKSLLSVAVYSSPFDALCGLWIREECKFSYVSGGIR